MMENKMIKGTAFGFISYHPAVKINYFILLMIIGMMCLHPNILLIIISMTLVYSVMLTSIYESIKGSKYFMLMGLMIMIVNPLFNNRGTHKLFMFFNRRITLEAIVYGGIMFLSLLSILLIFRVLQYVIDDHQFIYVIGKFLPKTALVITMTLRSIPMMLRRGKEIALIHQETIEKRNVMGRIRNGINNLNVLIMWSFESALITAESMEARGYGLADRTQYKHYPLKKKDICLMVIFWGLFCIIILLRVRNYLTMSVYPSMSYSIDGTEIIGEVLVLLLVALPIIIDIKERIIWRYMTLED